MKKLISLFLLIILLFSLACCDYNEAQNIISNYIVYDWEYITYNDNVYRRYDKYGTEFKDYQIFYELDEKLTSATYYSGGEKWGETELKTYIGDIQANFISQVEHWYDLFEPLVYGNIDNSRFNYLDDYDNVEKISIQLISCESAVHPNGEYTLSKELSEEFWFILSEMEKNKSYTSDTEWKKTDLECYIHLYIKDVNAAVYVGMLCYNTNDEICISNTNYTELHPLSSKWQNLENLFMSCEYVERSLLLE